MSDKFVAILMGSDSDLPIVQNAIDVLTKFGIRTEVKVTSAHRTPQVTHDFVTDAEKRGCGVFICAAGLAAHLAGAVAAITTRPVIGIPVDCGPLNGVDAAVYLAGEGLIHLRHKLVTHADARIGDNIG